MKNTNDEIVENVLIEIRESGDIDAVCRKYGISVATYNRWRKKYLKGDQCDIRQIIRLKKENDQLNKNIEDIQLENQILKDALLKKN